MKAIHFISGAEFRRWLEDHHASAAELQVAFYNQKSGKGGLTYPQAVDEALCFGWIDGIVHKLDADRHTRRFTPRRAGSIWSNINVGHVERLTKAGRMHPAGLAAFAARTAKKTGIYAFEQKRSAALPAAYAKIFKANRSAWTFFAAQASWYRSLVVHKIVSAKQEATRERWLARAIEASARKERLD